MKTNHFVHIRSALSALCILAMSSLAQASLIGDTIFSREGVDNGSGIIYYDEVLPGIEIIEIGPITGDDTDKTAITTTGNIEVNPGESGFVFSMVEPGYAHTFSGGGFNGFVISGFDYAPTSVISGFTLTGDLNYFGSPVDFTGDRISFTDDAVFMNFEGLVFSNGSFDVDLEFTAVPLPAGIWLFSSGLFGLIGFAVRKKQ